jgi:hypothetical protein
VEQALRSSSSMKELTDNLIKGGISLVSQMAQQMIPGPIGGLLGAGIQFVGNMLFHTEEPLPIKDNALEVRVINFSDMALDFVGIRDRSEIAYSRQRRQAWAVGAAAVSARNGG